MAHTPGPWKLAMTDDTLIVDHAREPIAQALGDYANEWEVMENNARLIAASPDLLDALTKLVNGASSGNSPTSAALLKNARAAIAKATGATP